MADKDNSSKEGTPSKTAAPKPLLTDGDNKFLLGVMKHLTGEINIPVRISIDS